MSDRTRARLERLLAGDRIGLAEAGLLICAEAAASSYLSSRPDDPSAPAPEAQRDTVRDLIRRMN